MESCFGSCEGRLSPETIRRWTENVHNVLSTDIGRRRFQDFLVNYGLEEGAELVTFWEMLHEVVPDESLFSNVPAGILRSAERILNYAHENDINLDPGLLQLIDKGIKGTDYRVIISTLLRIKEEISVNLEKYHELFKQTLPS